jgi:hypothetical protein
VERTHSYSQLGQYPDAIAMLAKGRLNAGDECARIAAVDEPFSQRHFRKEELEDSGAKMKIQ